MNWIFLFLLTSPDMARLLSGPDVPGADAVLVRHHVHTHVRSTGASTVLETKLYKVITPRGASLLTTLHFEQDPHTNTVEVISVRACRPDGTCRSWPYDLKTVPAPAGWILWRFNLKVLTMPALEPGEGLEIVTRRKGFMIAYLRQDGQEDEFVPPMKGHFYDQVLFGEEPFPTGQKEYELVVPAAMRLHVREYNGPIASQVRYTPQATTYVWRMQNLPAFKAEPMMPQASDSLPKVVLATVPDWEAKSRWFYEVNARQFEVTPAIKARVDEILRGAASREQKMALLTRWVANNIRYRGFSMGPAEGYTLHAGTQVFEERAGVCKDIASMLVTMLRAAGFEAYPAMTMAGARVEEEPADQFNHSVVAVRNPDGTFTMLDPTWAPLDRYVWSYAEREQHYVIGTPQGRTLEMIPPSAPEDNLLRLVVKSRLAGDSLDVQAGLEGRGFSDTSLRRVIGYAPLAERQRVGLEFLRKLPPDARLTRFTWTDPLNFDAFVRFDAGIRLPAPYVEVDGILLWKPVAMRVLPEYDRLLPFLALPPNPDRKHPVLLRSNIVVEVEETFEHPRALALRMLPAPVKVRTPAAELAASVRVTGKSVRFSARLVLPNRRVPAAAYADLVSTVQAFSKLDGFTVQLEVAK